MGNEPMKSRRVRRRIGILFLIRLFLLNVWGINRADISLNDSRSA